MTEPVPEAQPRQTQPDAEPDAGQEPRRREPVFNIPGVVMAFIAICVIAYFVSNYLLDEGQYFWLLLHAAFIPILYSGQIPVDANGRCPEGFAAQCRLAWHNVMAQLAAADMSVTDLVKVTIFLSDRRFGLENRQIRQEVLGGHLVASTVVIAGIFDERWLLEIEAVAVA